LPIETTMLRWIFTAWGWNSPSSLWSQDLYITSRWCKCWPW